MRSAFLILALLFLFTSCEERTEKMENSRGIPGPDKVEALAPDVDEQERELQSRGYQTRRRETLDTTYLMQEYYVAFLKKSGSTENDSTKMENLQEQHQEYLDMLAQTGNATLAGSVKGENEIAAMIVFNTPSQREADSLVQRSPLVQAGIMEAEVRPWWVNKGAQLE